MCGTRGCRSGYLSGTKKNKMGNKNGECEKHYSNFQITTKNRKRAIWISRVPRKDWHPDKNANYIYIYIYIRYVTHPCAI